MPLELFSTQTVFVDQEGINCGTLFIERLAMGSSHQQQLLQEVVKSYVNDIFQVKAIVGEMPKFGSDIDIIIRGVAKVLLLMGLRYEEQHLKWF